MCGPEVVPLPNSEGLIVTAETDAELAILRYLDDVKVLNDTASRDNVESITASNLALSRLTDARASLRVTLRRCAVFGCVLAAAWSAYLWAALRIHT